VTEVTAVCHTGIDTFTAQEYENDFINSGYQPTEKLMF
jgi:hypothetical protein